MENNNLSSTQLKGKMFVGIVISDKMNKTVKVESCRTFGHEMLGKVIRRVKRYKVHDETEIAKVGDIVEFFSGRPISKTKFMCLSKVIGKSQMIKGRGGKKI